MKEPEVISFPLVHKKKNLTYKIVIATSIALVLISVFEGIENSEFASIIFYVTCIYLIASQIFLDIRSLYIKEYQNIGVVTLNKNEIIFDTKSNSFKKTYAEVKSLTLEINETSHDPIFKVGVVGAGIFNRKLNGIENIISIELNADERLSYNFFVQDSDTISNIDSFIKNVNCPIKLKRRGNNITSIKDEHNKDYSPE